MFGNRIAKPLFWIGDIPVAVSISHIIFMMIIFMGFAARGPVFFLALIVMASFSVLCHEMGHAAVCKALGLAPEIELVAMGGLCYHQPATRPRDQILISFAGPFMNFVLSACSYYLVGHFEGLLGELIYYAMYVNLIWGIFNLLPILPFDGGVICRTFLHLLTSEHRAQTWTFRIGLFVGGGLAVFFGVYLHNGYTAMLLGFAAWQNLQAMLALGSAPINHAEEKHPQVRELLEIARQHYAAGRYDEALRTCHQARSEPHLSKVELSHVWTILALASAQTHDFQQALQYAERVPDSADMAQVQASCLIALGDADKIRKFLSSKAAVLLAPERIAALQALARA